MSLHVNGDDVQAGNEASRRIKSVVFRMSDELIRACARHQDCVMSFAFMACRYRCGRGGQGPSWAGRKRARRVRMDDGGESYMRAKGWRGLGCKVGARHIRMVGGDGRGGNGAKGQRVEG